MCIITGPRIDLAIALIDWMKKLFAVGRSTSKGLLKKELIKATIY